MFTRAITRRPGPDMVDGLTTATLGSPDFAMACAQHDAYVEALRTLGLEVDVLPALDGYPDACFVEDAAVVVPEGAVITRPGAPSRQGETETIKAALAEHRECVELEGAGTLEGGDVLIIGKQCLIGLSERTDEAGAGFLAETLGGWGYECVTVPVGDGLHFKTGVNWVGERSLLVAPGFVGMAELEGWDLNEVPGEEEYACNSLWVNGTVIVPAGYPRVCSMLGDIGVDFVELELSEYRKLDGGLTCLSLRL